MIKKILLLKLLIFFSFYGFTQSNFNFGSISADELNMPFYDKDTTANAVVLYEYGEAKIGLKNEKIELTFERTVRIKIFNSNGFDKANIEIPLHKSTTSNNKEKLLDVKAVAMNTDQTKRFLSKENVFTENVNEYYDLVKFTVPNIQEGVVIDYVYKISSPFYFNFVDWEFQSDIPKVFSRYRTSIPGNYNYNIKLVGPKQLDERKSDMVRQCLYIRSDMNADCVVETYTMKNIPAFKEEEYMTSKKNFLSAIRYELHTFRDFYGKIERYTKSWDDVDKEIKFSLDIGQEARREKYFEKFVPSEIAALPKSVKKAKKVYYLLQKELFWNGKSNIFKDINIKKAYESKSGSTSEINLILLNFLNASGFDANFMVLSTRDNGLPAKIYPVISEFNYLVVKLDIDGNTYLLDITDKNNPFGLLPYKTLNSYGRVMDFKNGSYWHEFAATNESKKNITMQIDVDEAGSASAKVREINIGYFAANKRNEIVGKSIENYLEELENKFDKDGSLVVKDYTVKDKENLDEPLTEEYKLSFTDSFKEDNIISPFLTDRFKKNPFNLEQRTYPVDFGYPFNYNYQIIFNLHNNYFFESIPENKNITLQDNNGLLLYQVKKNNNQLLINLRFIMKRSLFNAEEYNALKEIFSELVFLQNKQPILIKKVN